MTKEIWKPIEYENVIRGKYEISNMGRVRNMYTGKLLSGNNRTNEKGYIRVCLQTTCKPKKFPVHRMVMYAFNGPPIGYKEVNHIDGNPSNNTLENLEYVTRKENAEHASAHDLYVTCEEHHKSTFTNNEVHQICQHFSDGLNVAEVARLMGIGDRKHIITYLCRILNRESWTNISKNYSWSYEDVRYKTYKKKDIERMCKYLFIDALKISKIIKYFPSYNEKKLKNVLKKIKQLKLYKDISNKYIYQDKSSTTNERNQDGYLYIDINLG